MSQDEIAVSQLKKQIAFTQREIDAERNILSNPFNCFENMNMFRHTKTLGVVEVDSTVWKKLTDTEKKWIKKSVMKSWITIIRELQNNSQEKLLTKSCAQQPHNT